ncbi:MAG: hypothetical protein KF795_25800 [Labilithrix sp.]|nr:hypothetical protein [Labilithrix sp.]
MQALSPRGGRRAKHCGALAICAALARFFVAGAASAGEPAVPIRIDYAAPAACPDREALYAHVTARTRRARVAEPDEGARELVVRVDEEGGRFHGRLVIPASVDGARRERDVTDASCADLIEALGFFVALSVDPEASAEPTAPPAPDEAPAPRLRQAPVARGSRSRASRQPSAATVDRAPPWRVGGGTGAILASGVTPQVVVGNRIFLEAWRPPPAGSVIAPLVSLAAVSTLSGVETTALGGLALRWQALVGAVCPVALTEIALLTLRMCSNVEVGRLVGGGVGIRNPRQADALLVTVGLAGRAELAMSSMFSLGLEVGAASPMLRPRFSYSSRVVAFDTAAVGARVALALAVRF